MTGLTMQASISIFANAGNSILASVTPFQNLQICCMANAKQRTLDAVRAWMTDVLESHTGMTPTSWARAANVAVTTVTRHVYPKDGESPSVPSMSTLTALATAAKVPLPGILNRDHNAVTARKDSRTPLDSDGKIDTYFLGELTEDWRFLPGGVVGKIIQIDAGKLPRDRRIFTLEINTDLLGTGFPKGTVIGTFTDKTTPRSGEAVVVKYTRDELVRHVLRRVIVEADGSNRFVRMNDPLDAPGELLMDGEHFEIVGKVLEYRLQPEPMEGLNVTQLSSAGKSDAA